MNFILHGAKYNYDTAQCVHLNSGMPVTLVILLRHLKKIFPCSNHQIGLVHSENFVSQKVCLSVWVQVKIFVTI